MKTKLLKDISSRTLQVLLSQVLGVFIFMIVSRWLAKDVYGEMNWSISLLTFITTILSLRIEQIVVRKVAAGDSASKMLTLYGAHIFFSGILFYIVLLAGHFVFPSFFKQHNLLLILAISHLLGFFSTPYKQIVNGKEKFGWLAFMSSIATFIRAVWLLWVVIFSTLDIGQVLIIYIFSSLAELLVSMWLVQKRLKILIDTRTTFAEYIALLKESLPQIGVVFCNTCIGRLDMVLLGFFSTQVITGEYSFAYKIFELSPVPILIIGPVLITRFTVYFTKNGIAALANRQPELNCLIRFEMILATLLPLLLNIAWTPLIDGLTQNKYGAVNQTTFLLLSLCIPLQYMINLFWTIHFALNHLVLIFRITAITCAVIVIGDFAMIPMFNARGAALVYLAAILVEYLVYVKHSLFAGSKNSMVSLAACVAIAFASGITVRMIIAPLILKLILALIIYLILIILTKQVKKTDIALIRQWVYHQTDPIV